MSNEQIIIILLSVLLGVNIFAYIITIPEILALRVMIAKTIKFFLEEYAEKEHGRSLREEAKEADHES